MRYAILLLLGFTLSARGLVKAPTPVASFYATAQLVVVGKVTAVTDAGNVTATARTLKGDAIGETLRLRVEGFPAVTKNLKEGSSVVLLVARKTAALSIDDQWLFPEAVGGAKNFYWVKTALGDALRQSYPGTTSALVKAVDELAAGGGKYSMCDEVSPDMFKGAVKDLGSVDVVGAMTMQTLREAKTQTVIAISPAKMKKFRIESGAMKATETTNSDWPISSLAAVATVDMNGKSVPVVLARTGELTIDGSSAKPLWTGSTANTAAVGNFGEDGSVAAIVVTDDQVIRYSLDGTAPPADFVRLTGEKISTYHRDNPKWLAGATARPLDCNGDGRMDVLIVTPAGPMLLINRGFGCFFINPDLGKVLKTESGEPLPGKNLWTGADVDGDGNDDLLMIRPDGAASAVLNPKPVK